MWVVWDEIRLDTLQGDILMSYVDVLKAMILSEITRMLPSAGQIKGTEFHSSGLDRANKWRGWWHGHVPMHEQMTSP